MRHYSELNPSEKIWQELRRDAPLVLHEHGQLKTININALKNYCLEQPKSEGLALKYFIEWQSKKVMLAKLQNKSIDLYKGHHSYGLKHCVEQLSRELSKRNIIPTSEYCGNEEFIIAMLQAGFDCENVKENRLKPGPNYEFYIFPLSIRKPYARNWNYNGPDYWIYQLIEELEL